MPTSTVVPAKSATRQGEILEIPFHFHLGVISPLHVRRAFEVLRTRRSLCSGTHNFRGIGYFGRVWPTRQELAQPDEYSLMEQSRDLARCLLGSPAENPTYG